MRLFTAIAVPAEVRQKLADLLSILTPTAPLAWSPADNWHITTKFIGEFAHPELLFPALSALRVPPFQIEVRGLGWYPNPHQPRVLFAGVAAPEQLGDLHQATNDACLPHGIPTETKRFSPHLTLGRLRTPTTSVVDLRRAIADLPSLDFGRYTATSFSLYSSKPAPGGSIYHQLKEFPLG